MASHTRIPDHRTEIQDSKDADTTSTLENQLVQKQENTEMKSIKIITGVLVLVSIVSFAGTAQAGVPLNNLEGVGGIALNPLAYPANAQSDWLVSGKLTLSRPQFGFWYVNLHHVDINWENVSVAATLFKRLELSVGYQRIDSDKLDLEIDKTNFGQKFLVLNENAFGKNFIPAVAVGAIEKTTSHDIPGVDDHGVDFYLVATKLITQLPKPVLLSGGFLSTKAWVTGALGFDDDRDETGFANIDILLTKSIALGYEYKQGASFSDFKNADYWQTHVAWLPTEKLTFVGSYVDSGKEPPHSRLGLGDGVVFSVQYAF
jgi:hypothetical protein